VDVNVKIEKNITISTSDNIESNKEKDLDGFEDRLKSANNRI
jgi:hypothetical protein